ncbi:hypothetical protein [Bradyrhizobium sp. CCGE-LA001]|nr:hypothetical protein [Bradyrhizobium sp. CCGE-LA001]
MPIVKRWVWLIRKNLATAMLTFAMRQKKGRIAAPLVGLQGV